MCSNGRYKSSYNTNTNAIIIQSCVALHTTQDAINLSEAYTLIPYMLFKYYINFPKTLPTGTFMLNCSHQINGLSSF